MKLGGKLMSILGAGRPFSSASIKIFYIHVRVLLLPISIFYSHPCVSILYGGSWTLMNDRLKCSRYRDNDKTLLLFLRFVYFWLFSWDPQHFVWIERTNNLSEAQEWRVSWLEWGFPLSLGSNFLKVGFRVADKA